MIWVNPCDGAGAKGEKMDQTTVIWIAPLLGLTAGAKLLRR